MNGGRPKQNHLDATTGKGSALNSLLRTGLSLLDRSQRRRMPEDPGRAPDARSRAMKRCCIPFFPRIQRVSEEYRSSFDRSDLCS